MAKRKVQTKDNGSVSNFIDLLSGVGGVSLPSNFKEGRAATFALAKVEKERTLWTDMEEKESGNIIIHGITRKVNEMDFYAFCLAARQILYNQSLKSGHDKENSGLILQESEAFNRETGVKRYNGNIVASITDLCRGYGTDKPSLQQRKKMNALLDVLHSTPVKITFPNGDVLEKWLCVKSERYKRKEDGAILYNLILNPIFCEDIGSYSLLPQDIAFRLSEATPRLSAEHYRLLNLLKVQDKRKPFVRYVGTMVEELGITEAFKAKRTRTENRLIELFEVMKKVEIITGYKIDYKTSSKGKKAIEKITCYFKAEEETKAIEEKPV